MFFFSVCHAGALGKLALLVVCFDVLHGLHRQQIGQHGLTEHLFAVNHQLQRFAIPQQFTLPYAHTWQLFYKFQQSCSVCCTKGTGVEHNCVATHVEPAGTPPYCNLFQQMLVHLQAKVFYRDGVTIVVSVKLYRLAVITEVTRHDGQFRHFFTACIHKSTKTVSIDNAYFGTSSADGFLFEQYFCSL